MCGTLLTVAAGIVAWIMPGHRDGAARKILVGGHSTDIDGLATPLILMSPGLALIFWSFFLR
ncbi:hypothetical protein RS75_21455 [Rhizobium nepotum 39/7]|jgi:hypothetical protein|uniref:Phosphatidate cytidylyltransferase n=1 Tax=Rhizobium nepotum 39/7 TaxID=1368418 RepID=A0ABR5CLY7_9HYPH|nr:hypothetical protein RS75_21455 [Rhizobium nepotum 39/7]